VKKPNLFAPEFQKSIHVSWGENQTSFHRNFKKISTKASTFLGEKNKLLFTGISRKASHLFVIDVVM